MKGVWKAGFTVIFPVCFLCAGAVGSGDNGSDEDNDALAGEMILVRGGTFTMGCTPEQEEECTGDEYPRRQVTLSDFYIGKYEVTQKQWREIMGIDIRQQYDRFWVSHSAIAGEGDNYPMYYVSWYEVQEFIWKLNMKTGKNYRLPTEAEWEYAARGGNKSEGYKYSGSNDIKEVGKLYEYGLSAKESRARFGTQVVGLLKANELGIHDMSGNVWEWVNDWYRHNPLMVIENSVGDAQTNPRGPASGTFRMYRGGGWGMGGGPSHARVSARGGGVPSYRYSTLGFRLVRSRSRQQDE